jgi:hypothetical protein
MPVYEGVSKEIQDYLEAIRLRKPLTETQRAYNELRESSLARLRHTHSLVMNEARKLFETVSKEPDFEIEYLPEGQRIFLSETDQDYLKAVRMGNSNKDQEKRYQAFLERHAVRAKNIDERAAKIAKLV